jgi:hypothetical protein
VADGKQSLYKQMDDSQGGYWAAQARLQTHQKSPFISRRWVL